MYKNYNYITAARKILVGAPAQSCGSRLVRKVLIEVLHWCQPWQGFALCVNHCLLNQGSGTNVCRYFRSTGCGFCALARSAEGEVCAQLEAQGVESALLMRASLLMWMRRNRSVSMRINDANLHVGSIIHCCHNQPHQLQCEGCDAHQGVAPLTVKKAISVNSCTWRSLLPAWLVITT